MRIVKKFLIVIFLLTVICVASNNEVFAGYIKHNAREINIDLNTDGSINVEEIWNVYVDGFSTIYNEFELDKSKFDEIKDVTVSEITQKRL